MRDFNIDGILVGRPTQEVYEQSLTQHYPIGTIHERYGRRFRYCQAYEDITHAHVGCPTVNLHGGHAGGGVFAVMGLVGTAAKTGDRSFIMANVANGNPQTIFPEDWFYNGVAIFYIPSAAYNEELQIRISGSDVATATAIRMYLDEPLPCDIAATVWVECHPSPYLNIGQNTRVGALYSVNVVTQCIVTTAYYFWGQTNGPCYVQRDVGTCTSARRKVFISGILTDEASNDVRQQAGYTIMQNESDGMIQLMLE